MATVSNIAVGTPRVSIVLPLYRVKTYLPEAIASVKAQTFRDWECLCLDDGSDNGMEAFVRELTRDDARFVVRGFPNAGVAATRNQGLDLARGVYVAFLDQDDAFHPRFLATLVREIERTGADCAMTRFQSEAITWEPAPAHPRVIDNPCGWLLTQSQLMVSIWTKLWRRSALGGLRFDTTLFGSDDALFTFAAFARSRKVVFIPSAYHFYRRHSSAVSVQAPPRYLFAQLRFLRKLPAIVPPRDKKKLKRYLLKGLSDVVKCSGGGRYPQHVQRAVVKWILVILRRNHLSICDWSFRKLLRWRQYCQTCAFTSKRARPLNPNATVHTED